jgi:acid phosphatase (class A)
MIPTRIASATELLLQVAMMASLAIGGATLVCSQGVTPAPSLKPRGYLPDLKRFDVIRALPPAPDRDDARDRADRAIFRATRSLEGSARWALAARDNDLSIAGLFRAFRCALGVELSAESAPRITELLTSSLADTSSVVGQLKDFYKRKRPFLIDRGPICLPRTEELVKSFDYPSGHTTMSWAVGLLLAEAAPDRAIDILARARTYGESRVVCGVHTASAVEGGRTVASAVVAALHSSAAFEVALNAARVELTALRKKAAPITAASCASEGATLAIRPY